MRRINVRKGFTLVEVIVVLVILAILAAILVPSMVGWIDEANNKAAVVECRQCVTAAQTLASEAYAKNDPDGTKTVTTEKGIAAVKALAGVEGDISDIVIENGELIHLTYTDTATREIKYCRKAGEDGCGVSSVYTVDGESAGGGGSGGGDVDPITPATKTDVSGIVNLALTANTDPNVKNALNDYIKSTIKSNNVQINSNAYKVANSKASFVNSQLGINPETTTYLIDIKKGTNIETLDPEKDAGKYCIYYASQKITTADVNKPVDVVMYDVATGVYTSGTSVVKLANDGGGGNNNIAALGVFTPNTEA